MILADDGFAVRWHLREYHGLDALGTFRTRTVELRSFHDNLAHDDGPYGPHPEPGYDTYGTAPE
jgi:hypothetical protein